jgi:hypothetical protein
MGDTSPCMGGGGVTGDKNGGVRLGLAFVLRGKTVHVLKSSVHFASMVDNLVFKVQYFWTLKKTKCCSSIEKCSS